jgi:hypothetical protein
LFEARNLRCVVTLTTQWQTIPYVTTELERMVATGRAWRSFEIINNVVLARYCLAHDVSKAIIFNDHTRPNAYDT